MRSSVPVCVAAYRKRHLARDEDRLRRPGGSLRAGPPVYDGGRRLIDATVVDVADHADDFTQRPGASDANPFAECRRRPAPQLTGQAVRHDGHCASIVDIRPGEIATGEQRNPKCLEKAGSDDLGSPQWRNAFAVGLVLGGHHHVVLVFQLHRQRAGECGGRDPWDPGDLVQDVLLHPCDALGGGSLSLRDRDTHRLDVIRIGKSRLDASQRLEASNHEAGGDEQHDRQRDLHEHERVLRSMLSTTLAQRSSVTAGRSLQCLRPSYSGVLQDRQEPEQQGRQERHAKREGQNEWIDRDLRETRERCRDRSRPGDAGRRRQARLRGLLPTSRVRRFPRAGDVRCGDQPAPSAARTVSSRRRPSARTSSRLATLAHAMISTMPIVPISSHSTGPTSPITSCLTGRTAEPKRAALRTLALVPRSLIQIGSMRSTSALA